MGTHNNLFWDAAYMITLMLVGYISLRLENTQIAAKLIRPLLAIGILASISWFLTSSGETWVARLMNYRVIVLFIVVSGVAYSAALSINNKPDGTVYVSNSLIAFAWNVCNTLATGVFGVLIEPRFQYLPTNVKVAYVLGIVGIILVGSIFGYVHNEIEKVEVPKLTNTSV